MNHVHKDSTYLVSVKITVVNIRGGGNVFYHGVKTSELVSIAHVLKYLHEIMIFFHLKKKHQVILWRGHGAVIFFILTRQIFINFYRHGDRFYNRYINKIDKKGILMMMVLG